MYHNLKFLDFEVFPEWWCLVVSDEEKEYSSKPYKNNFNKEDEIKIKSKMRIYTSDDKEVINKIRADLSTGVLCGYNIKGYDLKILKCVLSGFTPQKLFLANEIIIHPDKAYENSLNTRIAEFVRFGWSNNEGFQDLMDDGDKKSLKDKECSLGMDIRETTVPFGKKNLTQQEKDDIIFYCKHDVYALHVFYVVVSSPYIDVKINLCNTFGIEKYIGYKSTNASLCCKVLNAQKTYGTDIIDPVITIRDKRLKEYLEKYVPSDILQWLLTTQESKTFEMCDNIVDIGDGGLHSVLKLPVLDKKVSSALYVESDDDYTMCNVDVSSCYPSIMIYCDSMPRSIKSPERFVHIFKRRINLKFIPKSEWSEDDTKFVPGGKLVLNTTYGSAGNKYLALYDDYMRSKVCRVGQLILIAIMNALSEVLPDMKIIQTNTDGILTYVKKSDIPVIRNLIDEFCDITHFIFEFEEDKNLWQLNVNNYIAVHPDGDIKNKGAAFITTIYEKGYNKVRPLSNFCIPSAQTAYYTSLQNGQQRIDPIEHIMANTSVEQFCLTCTKGSTYDNMIQYNQSGEVILGKVSRVIAVKDEEYGIIKKVKTIKKESTNKKIGDIQEDSIPLCPPHPLIVNDALSNYRIENGYLIHENGDKWQIDYDYYVGELNKALNINWFKLKGQDFELTKEFNTNNQCM